MTVVDAAQAYLHTHYEAQKRLRPGILVLYNDPAIAHQEYPESCAGVQDQVDHVIAALQTEGEQTRACAVTSYNEAKHLLEKAPEYTVLNLVEFLAPPYNACDIPNLCYSTGHACTGADTEALRRTTDKHATKKDLAAANIPVPSGICIPHGDTIPFAHIPPAPCIVKPNCSDASEGLFPFLDAYTYEDVASAVAYIHSTFHCDALIENMVGTRELQVAIITINSHPYLLPIAEIDFSALGTTSPHIIGYDAKWITDSFAYNNTPRRIPAELTPSCSQKILAYAQKTWRITDCRDYARVDFRLSADYTPYILEVNCNPDLSPDAGFVAALHAADISFTTWIKVLITNARRRAA